MMSAQIGEIKKKVSYICFNSLYMHFVLFILALAVNILGLLGCTETIDIYDHLGIFSLGPYKSVEKNILKKFTFLAYRIFIRISGVFTSKLSIYITIKIHSQ